MKRAIAYIRLSSYRGASDPSTAPERQREIVTHYCQAKGWEVVRVIEDLDVSGSEKGQRLDRPGLQAIRRLWDEIDVVVVPKLDRLARSVVDFHLFAAEAKAHGVDLVSVHEGLDLTTASGRFVASILAAFAQMEAETISERTREGRRGAAGQGRWTGGPVPYGYRSVPHPSGKGRSLELEPAEAEALRKAAAMVVDGQSLASVARWMNQQGPKPRRGGEWQRTTLLNILTGEAVLGRLTMGGKVLRDSDGYPLVPFPPVFSSSEADRIRAALAPTSNGKPVRYGSRLLSGLLTCSGCGGPLSTSEGIYRCYRASRGGSCPAPVVVSASAVEKHVEAEFLAEVGDLPLFERHVVDESEELAAVDDAIVAALDDLAVAATPERFAQLQRLQADRRRLATPVVRRVEAVATGQTVADAWAEADMAGRRKMLGEHYRPMVLLPGVKGRHGFDTARLELEPQSWYPPV